MLTPKRANIENSIGPAIWPSQRGNSALMAIMAAGCGSSLITNRQIEAARVTYQTLY